MKKNCFVMVNPAAGHGNAGQVYPEIVEQLKPLFDSVEVQLTQAPGDAFTLAKEAAPNYGSLVCMGGDGTSYEALNGLFVSGYEEQVYFGTIPLGTGNSFLRDFNLLTQQDVLEKIKHHRIQQVDVAKVEWGPSTNRQTRYFRNILGVGFIAHVCQTTNQTFKFAGDFGYSLGVFAELLRLKNEPIQLQIDGKTYERNNATLAISNSKYTGGKMFIAPMADVTDGQLDLILINDVTRFELIQAFLDIFKGTHIEHPKVEVLRGEKISLHTSDPKPLMIDGEVEGCTPFQVEVLSNRLAIYA